MKPMIRGLLWGDRWRYVASCHCGWVFNDNGASTWHWVVEVAEAHVWIYGQAGKCTRREVEPA